MSDIDPESREATLNRLRSIAEALGQVEIAMHEAIIGLHRMHQQCIRLRLAERRQRKAAKQSGGAA